ncbi:MAG: methyl-accepting chemotaxis protein [Deltaproteobacteria bacterium]|nr:methyl-accepting chemotaxis protein [Deltaproteobacteria bacterium]
MGSYLVLLVLFIVQIPIIYFLVGGMSAKYAQVGEAGSLRKRAVEITEILNRHIMSGNEELEKVFQAKKNEYGDVIAELRNGSKSFPAIKDPETLGELDELEGKWNSMRAGLDKAMEHGDGLRVTKEEVEKSTADMLDKAVGDGVAKARTLKMSYLFERYLTSYTDKDAVLSELKKTIAEFDSSVRGGEFSAFWQERKSKILEGVAASDNYTAQLNSLINDHTPQIVTAANALTQMIAENAKSEAMKGLLVMALSVCVSAAFAIFFMWTANTHLIKPIEGIKKTVEGFASGDLTRRTGVKVEFLGMEIKDEISSLGQSVDEMASQMSDIIGRITESSDHLASASEQLSASSTQMSRGAEKQSAQTAHAATAMEEMNATVIEVARNSQQAAESARGAREIAATGGAVVSQAITAMQEVAESTSVAADTIKKLGKSSEEIGTIVSVINDIADQTNLLALNAAIEAARAGEQGRGFAVVADEVRKLAERTTKATKEISGMIQSIQNETGKAVIAMAEGTKKVENGVKLANEAGTSLKQIVAGVEGVTDMIGHIATSAEEQSATTDEITQNMDSIADVAKSNVAAICEVSKATDQLAGIAVELKDLVTRFKIEREARQSAVSVDANRRGLHLIKTSPKKDPPLKAQNA